MRLVLISDTHNRHADLELPEGDLLVHAGDATLRGTAEELGAFAAWLRGQPHRHKLFVAGNHDRLFEDTPAAARALLGDGILYLQDAGVAIEGVRFWGSPWQPWFLSYAFNLPRGRALRERWALIPEGTDVLVTHGPPRRCLDRVGGTLGRALGLLLGQGPHAGCDDLRDAVARLRPRLHVFGHIHEGYGQEQDHGTRFVNASSVDARYHPVNPPVVVDL